MSDTKKAPRSLEEIQKEYNSLCLRAGHVQYQIQAHANDLKVINDQLRDLNFEAVAIQEAAAKAKESEGKADEKTS